MRIEFWLATNTNSLIYRMLVLNTGQVPWDLRRQIEVIHKPLIKELKQNSSIELLEKDDERRRARAGQFQANRIVELYMVFGARKEKIDTKERLAAYKYPREVRFLDALPKTPTGKILKSELRD